ncbi:hypothetical protein BH23BAC2_BH23BAC2_13650 [soil metagenome]
MFQFVSNFDKRRLVRSVTKRLARKMQHETKKGIIIFPNHGSQEMGKGLENKTLKDAGIKKQKNGRKEKNYNMR